MTKLLPGEAACRVCGCVDSRACPGGCYWIKVDYKRKVGLCSQCVGKKPRRKTRATASKKKPERKRAKR